jgi:hypothetical protein
MSPLKEKDEPLTTLRLGKALSLLPMPQKEIKSVASNFRRFPKS